MTEQPPRGPVEESRESGSIGGLAGSSYLALLLGVVTGPLIARAVGPEGRGEIAAAVVYSALAATAVSLGVPLAVGHALANRLQSRVSLLSASVRFSLATVPVALLLAAAVVWGPLSGQSLDSRIGAGLLLAGVPIVVLTNCLALFFVGEGALRGLARVQLIPFAFLASLTVAAFALGRLTVLVYLVLVFATSLATAVISWREVGARPKGSEPLGPLIRFGLRGYPGYLAVYAAVRIDQAFIGPWLGARALGFYAVAASVAVLPVALSRAIASRAFATLAGEEEDARGAVISNYLKLALMTASAACAGVALVSPLLMPMLYGEPFARSVRPLLILLPGTIAMCGSVVGMTCLTALGTPGRATLAEVAGLVVTVAGMPLVIFRYGITGAAALSTGSYLVTFALYLYFLGRHGRLDLRPRVSDVVSLWSVSRELVGRVAGAKRH